MPRHLVISILVSAIVVIVAFTVFSSVNRIPDAGMGRVNDENSAANTPEHGSEPAAN